MHFKPVATWFILCSTLLWANPAQAQSPLAPPEVIEYTFGEKLVFQTRLEFNDPPQSARLTLSLPSQSEPLYIPASLQPQENGSTLIQSSFNLAGQELPAFSSIEYSFEVTTQSEQVLRSPSATFVVTDNRFTWQTLNGGPFQISWYGQGQALAEQVQRVASLSQTHLKQYLKLEDPRLVEIYIYPDTDSLQAVLAQNGHRWVAGQAEPDKGIILVALPAGPDQQALVEQRIPHELMHIYLFNTYQERYKYIPAWLNEGLATVAELYPNPDYPAVVERAYQAAGLTPFQSLCQKFPSDTSAAMLAYAQSTALTRYVLEKYGQPGIQALVEAYANGQDCETSPQAALGKSLTELENDWRQETFVLGQTQPVKNQGSFVPWLVLLFVTLAAPLVLGLAWLRR